MIPDEVRRGFNIAIQEARWGMNKAVSAGKLLPQDRDSMWAAIEEAQAWLANQPQAPQPDWSQAPSWAMWAVAHFRTMAIGPVGAIWTFTDIEPTERNEFGWMMTGRRWGGVAFDIPFGVDPRTLKQRRPEVSNE